jgi:hypothetical protein
VKLLHCLNCKDVFRLDFVKRRCTCGQTEGHYLNLHQARYGGESAVPLAFVSDSFRKALKFQDEKESVAFRAFVVAKYCPTFLKREAKEEKENGENDSTRSPED